MTNRIPETELAQRMERFIAEMDRSCGDWEVCAVTGGVNLFYFTGTICDGMLFIQRGKGSALWVKRDYSRAVLESGFPDIRPMSSFREPAAAAGALPDTLYLDMAQATMEWYGLLGRHMKFGKVLPVDRIIMNVRAVKSDYEIGIMRRSGKLMERLLTETVPALLREGMSEAELGAEIYPEFVKGGGNGISRFLMRNTEVVLGHIGFGTSPLYPSVFNGASGVIEG